MAGGLNTKNNDINTYSELILALPGESKLTHTKGIKELFKYDTSIVCYNLMMLNGSDLNTPKNRKQFGIETVK